jgi:hypothetical protein
MHAKVVEMQAKIKDQQKAKQSNKQSLVWLDKVIPSGVTMLSRGHEPAQCRLATTEALIVPPMWGVECWECFLDLIIKLWLMFRSLHLVLWSLGTYGLRKSG